MRYHSLRYDIWICLAIGLILGMGLGKIVNMYLTKDYEDYKMEHKVDTGNVGGKADASTYRANSIEDLLSHETFTVVSPGIQYKNRGAGFYKNFYMYALTLPSGEVVAARINGESVVTEKTDNYKDNSILPVGRIVYEDLKEETSFLDQIEYQEPLSRTDFYIDMVGEASIESEESFIDGPVILTELITIIISFPILHTIGSKFGIFPYFFEPRIKS